jgi:hypothetical protein
MPAVEPDVQALLAAMLTPDPGARITVDQIKCHQAFRIGLSAGYQLPRPLPLCCGEAGVDPRAVAPPVLALLRAIGFRDEELTAHGETMAKSFCYALTHALAPEELPWDDEHRLGGESHENELIQPCVDIAMAMDELMGKMQEMLGELGFQWFHPDDTTIFARSRKGAVVTVRAEKQEDESVKMDVHFGNADEAGVDEVLERLRDLLVGDP